MRRARQLLLQTSALTATSLLMRLVAMTFQVYVAGRIGAAGIGLFQLIMSIYMMAVTVAASGIRLASTRLISEQAGQGNPAGVRRAVRCSIGYSAFFGCLAMLLLFYLAPTAGEVWAGDPRTVLSLKILAFALPFVAVSSALSGYFVAMHQSVRMSLTQLAEQVIQIGCTILALSQLMNFGLEYASAALTLGMLAAEIFSFTALLLLFFSSWKKEIPQGGKSHSLLGSLLKITVPLSLSSYARSALSTLQHLLIPRGLQQFGGEREAALAAYGVIQGMSLPVLLFPAVLIAVIADLIVPELTEAQVQGRMRSLTYMLSRLYQMGLIFSIGVGGLCFFFSEPLGMLIYHNVEATRYIRILAPLVPAMYMDTLVDGMLKGVGEYRANMRYNIIDAGVGLLLVWQLIPRFGIEGYIISIAVTELLNFALSAWRLARVTDFRFRLMDWIRNILCFTLGGIVIRLIFRDSFRFMQSLPGLLLGILLMLLCYFMLLFLSGGFRKGEISWLYGLIRKEP